MTDLKNDPKPTAEQAAAYAWCLDCGATFDDRDAMRAHFGETTNDAGQSHRARVQNPTQEEGAQHRLRVEIAAALDAAADELFTTIERLIEDGEVTLEQAHEEITRTDFDDLWSEWRRDAYPDESDEDEEDDPRRPGPLDQPLPFEEGP